MDVDVFKILLGMFGTGFIALSEVVRRMYNEQKALTKHSIKCDIDLTKAKGDIALLEHKVQGLTGQVVDRTAEMLATKLLETARLEAARLLETAKEAATGLEVSPRK